MGAVFKLRLLCMVLAWAMLQQPYRYAHTWPVTSLIQSLIVTHRFDFQLWPQTAASQWTCLAIARWCLILATLSRPILTLTCQLNCLGWLQAWFITRDLFGYLDSYWTWLPTSAQFCLPCWGTVELGTLWCNCFWLPSYHPWILPLLAASWQT